MLYRSLKLTFSGSYFFSFLPCAFRDDVFRNCNSEGPMISIPANKPNANDGKRESRASLVLSRCEFTVKKAYVGFCVCLRHPSIILLIVPLRYSSSYLVSVVFLSLFTSAGQHPPAAPVPRSPYLTRLRRFCAAFSMVHRFQLIHLSAFVAEWIDSPQHDLYIFLYWFFSFFSILLFLFVVVPFRICLLFLFYWKLGALMS